MPVLFWCGTSAAAIRSANNDQSRCRQRSSEGVLIYPVTACMGNLIAALLTGHTHRRPKLISYAIIFLIEVKAETNR